MASRASEAQSALIERYARPAPRYTSYPTANHFAANIRPLNYIDWLAELEPATPLSIYIHIPFCQQICWYCACTTKGARRHAPVRRYVEALEKEIANVSTLLPGRLPVTHIHWGGGSPNMLEPDEIASIAGLLRRRFAIVEGKEHAVEIDPRHLTPEQVEAFVAAGVNRVSLGVQDFDPKVQQAIGREQDVALTDRALTLFRERGVGSVNFDLVYGLPAQTVASLERTLDEVVRLSPDRIAAFGYAHLPERVKPQRLIDATTIPTAVQRFELAETVAARLTAAGYRRIGLDHFARPADGMTQNALSRNFQGYTTDPAEVLLGFGASAIGKLQGGFVQNAITPADYQSLIDKEGLATVRGIALSEDDRIRAHVIERLMCDFTFSADDLVRRFGKAARPVIAIAADLVNRDCDGFLALTAEGLEITESGRPFTRTICTAFDRYFARAPGRHSVAL